MFRFLYTGCIKKTANALPLIETLIIVFAGFFYTLYSLYKHCDKQQKLFVNLF